MRRVMVLGAPGSGKSTLARRIGAMLDIRVFHLDRFYHRAGWRPPPPGEFAADVAKIAALPTWIIDGNYPGTANLRRRVADTIVYLDVPRGRAFARVVRRTVIGWGRQRSDSADGCPERLDRDFLRYVWNWERDSAPQVRAMLEGFAGRTIILASASDIRAFCASL